MSNEWDAEAYDRLSDPQYRWGKKVLDRIDLRGDETAIDAGCGTGRLTSVLLERLPRGRVIAIDGSQNMLNEAASRLVPRYGARVELVCADLLALALDRVADVIVSTATFHWLRDHETLFRNLYGALVGGGWLVAQCGGAGNLARLLARANELTKSPSFAPYFRGWEGPWEFADAETTRRRLEAAGFTDVDTNLEDEPTAFIDRSTFELFVITVILRLHLERLPSDDLRRSFMTPVVDLAEHDDPPFVLDYRRLNLRARRPS
jgi:trans-aconitate 2-methyltransferase